MRQERPFSHESESLPPYPYNIPGMSANAFRRVQEKIQNHRYAQSLQTEGVLSSEVPPLTDELIHQWCWEARLAEHGTMPVAPARQQSSVDTQRPRVEYVANPNGYLPKLVFPTGQSSHGEYIPTPNGFVYKDTSNQERSVSPRRNAGESERPLPETMAAAGHAYYTLMKTAMQHPELTPAHRATVSDFGFALHQALLTRARTGDMASLSLNFPGQEHEDADIGDVISQALVVPGSPRLYVADNALPASLSEQYYQQSIIPDVFIDTRRPSYAPDSFPLRTLAGYNRVPTQVRTYFTGNA